MVFYKYFCLIGAAIGRFVMSGYLNQIIESCSLSLDGYLLMKQNIFTSTRSNGFSTITNINTVLLYDKICPKFKMFSVIGDLFLINIKIKKGHG
jgi:hypothetical protein